MNRPIYPIMIKDSVEFLELIMSLIENEDGQRLHYVSVSSVFCVDKHDRFQLEIQYIFDYYVVGPFKQDIHRNIMRNPVFLCERDVIQFIVHSLSDIKSPYFFNVKTGKFKCERIFG